MRGDEQAVDMEDRQRVDQHVAALGWRAPVPVVLERQRVREQVAVAQHRPLAAPGRAAGVEDRRQVVALARRRRVGGAEMRRPLEQAAAAVVAEGEDPGRSRGEGELGGPDEILRRADEDGRFGIADEIGDLVALVGGVERQVDMAGAQHREVEQQRLDRLLDLHRDPARAAAGRASRAGWRASPSPARGRASCSKGPSRRSRSRSGRGRRESRRAGRRTGWRGRRRSSTGWRGCESGADSCSLRGAVNRADRAGSPCPTGVPGRRRNDGRLAGRSRVCRARWRRIADRRAFNAALVLSYRHRRTCMTSFAHRPIARLAAL